MPSVFAASSSPDRETSPASRATSRKMRDPNPLPAKGWFHEKLAKEPLILERVCETNGYGRPFIPRNPRATRRAVGKIDVELPAALVGPAPRRKRAHVGLGCGDYLQLVHRGSASSSARAARPR
jgi:hypothetical protein